MDYSGETDADAWILNFVGECNKFAYEETQFITCILNVTCPEHTPEVHKQTDMTPWTISAVFVAISILALFCVWIGDGNRPKIQHENLIESFLNESAIDKIPENGALIQDDPYASDTVINDQI